LQKKFIVKLGSGIHARPAQKIVEAAQGCSEDIFLVKNGQLYNAKSLLMILSMSVKYMEEIEVVTDENNAECVVEQIGKVLTGE